MARILAVPGSARSGSLNARLVRIAAQGAEAAGGDVTVLDPREHALPLYDADLESGQGLPDAVLRLKQEFRACDGLLIASPEYNGSITPLLKNTIDWISRPSSTEPGLKPFRGKVAALLAASPGSLGGLRGLVHVRAILSGIGVLVLPDQLAVPKAHEGIDDKTRARIEAIVGKLAETTARLHA